MYHQRRPNFIVRGLYMFFYFLADFGPMFGALFSFLGRSSLVVVNLVILAGTIVMSAAHSLALLRYAGLRDGLEWVGMTVWELVFIFSSILLANDFRRGNWRSGWATWTGFAMGFAFVEVSNVMGMADNRIGVAIGIATPILLLVSKGLLAHQFKSKREADNQVDMSKVDIGRVDIKTLDISKVIPKVDMSKVDTATVDMARVDVQKVDTAKVDIEEVDTSKVDTAKADVSKVSTPRMDTAKIEASKVDVSSVDIAKVDTSNKVDTPNRVDTSEVDTAEVDIPQVGKARVDTEEVDTSKVDTVTVDTTKVDMSKVDVQKVDTAKVVELASRSNKKSTDRTAEIARVKKLALRIEQQTGERPGRKKLMKLAGCTEYVAKKVLEELDQTG